LVFADRNPRLGGHLNWTVDDRTRELSGMLLCPT
jgi:hypothetical protein